MTRTGNGIGLGTLTALVLVVFKLAGVVDWSWWLVTAPLWIPIVLTLALAVLVGAVTGAVAAWRARG